MNTGKALATCLIISILAIVYVTVSVIVAYPALGVFLVLAIAVSAIGLRENHNDRTSTRRTETDSREDRCAD